MKQLVALFVLTVGFLSSCAGPTLVLGTGNSLTISVSSPFLAAGSHGRALVGLPSESVQVTLSGGATKRQTVTLKDKNGVYTGSLECPSAPGVTFTIVARDSAGVTYAQATTTVDIVDASQTIQATLVPVLPASVPVVKAKVFAADWANVKAGQVGFVQFAPELTEATDFSATMTDAVLAVVRADGSVVARGTNAWSQKVGEVVYFVYAKTADTADLVVGLSGRPKADLPTAGKFYTAWVEGFTRLYLGTTSLDAAGVATTVTEDGSVTAVGNTEANGATITFNHHKNLSTGFTIDGTVKTQNEVVGTEAGGVLRGSLSITDEKGTIHSVGIDYGIIGDFVDGTKSGTIVIDEFSFDVTVLSDQVKTTLVRLLDLRVQGALIQAVFAPMHSLQNMVVDTNGTGFTNLDGSFVYTFITLSDGMELTYTYTNYLDVDTGFIYTGTLVQKIASTATSTTYTFTGKLAVSGKGTHSVDMALSMVGDETQSTATGTFTIDGMAYPFGTIYGTGGPLGQMPVEAYEAPPAQSVLKVYTVAGTGSIFSGSTGIGLNNPTGLTAAVSSGGGSQIYVADTGTNSVKRISVSGGSATWATSNLAIVAPTVVAVSSSGGLFAADGSNRLFSAPSFSDAATPSITGTGAAGLADGAATIAQFNGIEGGVLNPDETYAYVADTGNGRIRKVDLITGDVTTLTPTFSSPSGVAVDRVGNVYVSDSATNRIWKIPGGTGTPVAFAGATDGSAGFADGTGADARFSAPHGIALDQHGNLYVADTANNRIRAITPGGVVTTLGGTGTASSTDAYSAGGPATFNAPWGIWVNFGHGSFVVYVTDSAGNRVRMILR